MLSEDAIALRIANAIALPADDSLGRSERNRLMARFNERAIALAMRSIIAIPSLLLFLTNIAGISSPTLSQLPVSAADLAQTPTTRYQPLPPAACNQLAQAMTNSLKVRVRMTRGSFVDYINREQGIGCQLLATGNGRNFSNISNVVGNLSALLAKQGWLEVSDYTADGPTEVARGFRQGNNLAIFNVEWEPASGASCPPNEPISACQLTPEQQIYRIRLNAATK